MAEINEAFVGHSGPTDVICFDYRESKSALPDDSAEEAVDVEIIICPAVARREAEKRSLPYAREVVLYLAHGLLHASGEDDLKPEGDLIAQALQLFQALNRTHPDEAQGFFIHAKFLILIERGPEALPLLEQALTLDSSAYSTWDLLLYACNMAQDTARMEKYGKAASARFPEQPGPEMYLAIASFLKGDYAAAAEQAQASLGKDFLKNPFLQKVNWQILGDAYFELGKEQESLSAYEHLFRLDPEDRYVRNNYAYYLALTGRELEKAESLAAQLCKEEPGNPTFLDTYGWVLYRKGQYGKALDYVKAALENGSSDDATVLEHYGDILYRLGERRQASEYWEKALQRARKDAANALEEKIKNPEQWIP